MSSNCFLLDHANCAGCDCPCHGEPEDATPAPKRNLLEGAQLIATTIYNHEEQTVRVVREPQAERGGDATESDTGVPATPATHVAAGARVAETHKSDCLIFKYGSCNCKPHEPVAQPGAEMEKCAKYGRQLNQHYTMDNFCDGNSGPTFEPASGQVGAEQWLDNEKFTLLNHSRQIGNKWDTKSTAELMEAYAAHVTKGLEEKLSLYEGKDYEYWREKAEAAEARNVELMGALQAKTKDYFNEQECRVANQDRVRELEKQLEQVEELRRQNSEIVSSLRSDLESVEPKLIDEQRRVQELMGELERWHWEMAKVTALGEQCTPQEVGDFVCELTNVAMERLKRLAEAEKAAHEFRYIGGRLRTELNDAAMLYPKNFHLEAVKQLIDEWDEQVRAAL